jgi:hypothetical protein
MGKTARNSIGSAIVGLCLALSAVTPALAQGAKVTSAVELARQADRLRPGQWVWAPQIAPTGPITVYVDLSRQLATIYRNGVRIGVSTISSGKPGHATPTGVFVILQKDAKHRSSTYNNAPMPYQQRLTWDGVALHAGGLPGYPESHGCVHLPLEFSRLLFGETHMGGTVIVAGRAGAAHLTHAAGVLAPQGEGGTAISHVPLDESETFRWTPEVSPQGPLTVVISRSDQRMVVLRNGVEIGRARAVIPGDDFETHVMTYTKLANGQGRWIVAGVPGHGGENGQVLDTSILNQLRLPRQFHEAVNATLVPGATVLVTQAPVLPENTGAKMTIMASK